MRRPRRRCAALALLLGLGAAAGAGCGERGGAPGGPLSVVAPAPDGAWVAEGRVEGDARTVRARDGRAWRLPLRPRRVVSLLPGLTESVAALAGTEVLVGVSPWCDEPAGVRGKPTLSVQPVDLERLAALAPDLVLCDATLHAASLPDLRRFPAPVLEVESASVPHLAATLRLLGQVLGSEGSAAAGEALARDLEAAAEEAARARPAAPPRVLLLSQDDPLYVLGPGALLDDLLRVAGCVNVAADLGRASGPFSLEALLARAPDWILTTSQPLSPALRERLRGVPAVQTGRVAHAGASDLLRAGPRTAAGLRRLAAVLHGALPPERLGGGA